MTANRDLSNLTVLVFSQALWVSSGSILLSLSGVVGDGLSPLAGLATLPFALMLVIGSLATIPASLYMLRRGRRAGFALGIAAGCASGVISAVGLFTQNFWLFCLGMATWGIAAAFGQYYRFAASEFVDPGKSGSAIAWVLAGSVLGVLTGPQIAIHTRTLIPSGDYAASFLAVSAQCVLALVVIRCLRVPMPSEEKTGTRPATVALLTRPTALAGIVNGTVASCVMVFVMTGAPIAMIHLGHMGDDAVEAIQFHLLGMYAPSFVSGHMADRLGAAKTSITGLFLLVASLVVAANGQSMLHFNVAMFVLGVGWNLLYVSSSVILSRDADPGVRATVQAACEFSINSAIALAAFLAGTVFAAVGWSGLLAFAVPMLAASLVATLRFAWLTESRRDATTRVDVVALQITKERSSR